MNQRILLTPGEPAGIGPDVTLKTAQKKNAMEVVVIADPDLLGERAEELKIPIKLIIVDEEDLNKIPSPAAAKQLKILPVKLKGNVKPGKLNAINASYVIATIKKAASLCLNQRAAALVTGPVHKGILNQAGIPFVGHTEYLAKLATVKHTVMMFVLDQLKVALATTHLPLAKVSPSLTQSLLRETISILYADLKKWFSLTAPRILISGLNPHAGEGGVLGREEIEVVTPVITELRQVQYQLEGPLPADTIFLPKNLQRADAILALYHDQALPVVKYIGFDRAVNVTLGLPFVRTSVDHGTALEMAGTGSANCTSMENALALAIKMISSH